MSETNFPNNFPAESEMTLRSQQDEDLEIISMRADLSSEDEEHLSPEMSQSVNVNQSETSENSEYAEVSSQTRFTESDIVESQFPEKISLDNFSRNTDWFNLARKLRQHNRELVKTVVQLEQALAESQEALQTQLMRSRSTDTLLAQQSEELNNAQEQITRLFRELEASHQTGQRQQILIDSLSQQFQESQEHIAQLEQEYYLTQETLTQKSQQLEKVQKEAQELRERLYHQEQANRKYKSALEVSETTPKTEATTPETEPKQEETVTPLRPYTTNPTGIKPWSSSDPSGSEALKFRLNLKDQDLTPELESPQPSPIPKPVRLPIEPIEQKPSKASRPLIQEYPTKPVQPVVASFDIKEKPLDKIKVSLDEEPDSDLITATEELLAEVLEVSQEESKAYLSEETQEIPESIDENNPEYFDRWESLSLSDHPEMEFAANYPSPTISIQNRPKKPKSRANVDLPSFLR
jgi:hypothetical protein